MYLIDKRAHYESGFLSCCYALGNMYPAAI